MTWSTIACAGHAILRQVKPSRSGGHVPWALFPGWPAVDWLTFLPARQYVNDRRARALSLLVVTKFFEPSGEVGIDILVFGSQAGQIIGALGGFMLPVEFVEHDNQRLERLHVPRGGSVRLPCAPLLAPGARG